MPWLWLELWPHLPWLWLYSPLPTPNLIGLRAGGRRRRRRRQRQAEEGRLLLVGRRQVRQVAQGAHGRAAGVAGALRAVRQAEPEAAAAGAARRGRGQPAEDERHARRGQAYSEWLPHAHPVRGHSLQVQDAHARVRAEPLARAVLRGHRRAQSNHYPSPNPSPNLTLTLALTLFPDLSPNPNPNPNQVIAEVCDVGKKDYALGLERMFFRLGCAAFLEELSEADPVMLTSIVLRFIVFVRYCSLLHCMCALLFFAALYVCATVLCCIVFVRYCALLHCICAVLFVASLYVCGTVLGFIVFARSLFLLHGICAVLFFAALYLCGTVRCFLVYTPSCSVLSGLHTRSLLNRCVRVTPLGGDGAHPQREARTLRGEEGGARPHREGPDHVGVQAAYILLTTH